MSSDRYPTAITKLKEITPEIEKAAREKTKEPSAFVNSSLNDIDY